MARLVPSSRLIAQVLSPAVKLWLRSQVEAVAELSVEIGGADRQFLAGQVAQVAIAAQDVVYQGLHLQRIEIEGKDIRTNLPQVLRGKAFQLLEPIAVQAVLVMDGAALNASLESDLLRPVVAQWLGELAKALPAGVGVLRSPRFEIIEGGLRLWVEAGERVAAGERVEAGEGTGVQSLGVEAGIVLAGSQGLTVRGPKLLQAGQEPRPLPVLESMAGDLGTDVVLESLGLGDDRLRFVGVIRVSPLTQ